MVVSGVSWYAENPVTFSRASVPVAWLSVRRLPVSLTMVADSVPLVGALAALVQGWVAAYTPLVVEVLDAAKIWPVVGLCLEAHQFLVVVFA